MQTVLGFPGNVNLKSGPSGSVHQGEDCQFFTYQALSFGFVGVGRFEEESFDKASSWSLTNGGEREVSVSQSIGRDVALVRVVSRQNLSAS